ncbi:ATP-binding cassette domain-containing protein [Fulvivirgaceae bacterium BMA12]|uniref:ATP-binding cassette domain-containing protein n=1 Tax=Agaribacillus aureus TaxID=3051825 RepID=A0ABT8L8G2_9BACT|nr:ATP-binding cassette domain-containing protein [Fulvivirgaceae bacterium BMA12]
MTTFSNDPVVSVRNATIYQDENAVLKDVNFDIEKGEFVYLVGRTGSGKSSLLKTLYADLKLQVGAIYTGGFELKDIKSKKIPLLRRKLGIIFQDFQLFHDRTISENLYFVMKATGWKERSKMKARLTEVLMKVGLGAYLNKMPHQLSGGEQQRVVIARALINEPILLIADEPTGNLDPAVADGIHQIFLDINNSGTAILMATHDHRLINANPARVLKCSNGQLLDSKSEKFDLTDSQ